MRRERDESLVFVCRNCETRIYVDDEMRETLIRAGCIECDGAVSPADFERE